MIEIAGKKYELVCTTAAYVEICRKYGGIEEMAEIIQGPQINEWDDDDTIKQKEAEAARAASKVFEVIPWLVAVLANQGTMLALRKTKLTEDEELTEDVIRLFTTPKDITGMTPLAMEALSVGFGMEHKGPETDPTLEAVEKQERKNAESAAE